MNTRLKAIGNAFFDGDFTVEIVQFIDGDERQKIIHVSESWGPTNYVQKVLWVGCGELWTEYYEHDTLRYRDVEAVDVPTET